MLTFRHVTGACAILGRSSEKAEGSTLVHNSVSSVWRLVGCSSWPARLLYLAITGRWLAAVDELSFRSKLSQKSCALPVQSCNVV